MSPLSSFRSRGVSSVNVVKGTLNINDNHYENYYDTENHTEKRVTLKIERTKVTLKISQWDHKDLIFLNNNRRHNFQLD